MDQTALLPPALIGTCIFGYSGHVQSEYGIDAAFFLKLRFSSVFSPKHSYCVISHRLFLL